MLSESEAPVPPTEPDDLVDSPALSRDEPSSSKAWEGGYRSNRPSAALVPDPSHVLPEAVRGRSRWKQVTPASTSSPPCGVEPAPTSPSSSTSHEEETTPHKIAPWRRVRRTSLKPSAVKSKAVKPRSSMGESQPLPSIPEQGPPQEPPPLQTHVHTGLETLAVDRIKDEVVADPDMPEPAATTDHPADREETTAEIYIQELQPHKEEKEQAGTVHTDIALQSEQRAMQELHRFQKLSLLDPSQPGASPPAPPPTNLYAMLPREWPLARMSVLRVTLLRRLAELSFRGIGFTELPREVVREVHHDVDGIFGAVAY